MSKDKLTKEQREAIKAKTFEKRQLEKGNVLIEGTGNPNSKKADHLPKGKQKWVGQHLAATLIQKKLAKKVKGDIEETVVAKAKSDIKEGEEKLKAQGPAESKKAEEK